MKLLLNLIVTKINVITKLVVNALLKFVLNVGVIFLNLFVIVVLVVVVIAFII